MNVRPCRVSEVSYWIGGGESPDFDGEVQEEEPPPEESLLSTGIS